MEENKKKEHEGERPPSFSINPVEEYFTNWQELVSSGAISTSRTIMRQKGFSLSPQNPKARRRKRPEPAGAGGVSVIRPAGRKDRHSKVCTARGTRDRRVRLSPGTAIQFYDVQDRLCYDRPSKAIDWLMREAKAAIDALENEPPLPQADFVGNRETKRMWPNWSNDGGFDFITDEYAQGFSPSAPLTAASEEIFCADLESGKMRRTVAWSYSNGSVTGHFSGPGPSVSGHDQISRETLQSSHSRIGECNNPMTTRFPSFDFSDDLLPEFTTPEENEVDNIYTIPVSGEQSSSVSFLHYEE